MLAFLNSALVCHAVNVTGNLHHNLHLQKNCPVDGVKSCHDTAPGAGNWLTKSGWLKLANDAFYLIGSTVFQCTNNH
jgi:hypothetical protein